MAKKAAAKKTAKQAPKKVSTALVPTGSKFPVTSERFLAYFDIMGFKDYTLKNSHEDVRKRMIEIQGLLHGFRKHKKVRRQHS
jgi:hypothetical protein